MAQHNGKTPMGSRSSVEELRELLDKLINSDDAQQVSERLDPEDATLEEQIPELVADPEEQEQPTFSKEDTVAALFEAHNPFSLIYTADEGEEKELIVNQPSVDVTEPVGEQQNPFAVLWGAFCAKLPAKGETALVLVRKLAWLLAVAVFLCSVVFLVCDMAVQPAINAGQYDRLAALWQPENQNVVSEEGYPRDMLECFAPLYNKNTDVRGWLTYTATGDEDFLSINYPVVQTDNNDTYCSKNFYGRYSKSGALFFHKDNHLEEDNHSNKALVVYGNTTIGGQMFAGLNKLVGNVNFARSAATMTLSTLFEQNQYKVIAVVITDEQAETNTYFDPCRLTFSTNGQFMDYVDEVRARSLFDFPVEVIPGDQLLMLSTSASRSVSKLGNGRLTVIARKVRSGEGAGVVPGDIVKNEDVIMPYAWYEGQGMQAHSYYETGELPE